jgi:hypothetical protein
MKNIANLFTASIAIKIIYLIFAAVIMKNLSVISFTGYLNVTHNLDSGWYNKIVENGYPKITDKDAIGYGQNGIYCQSEWGFFPFYPLMNKILMKLCRINFQQSGFIISILFSFLSLLGFYQICKLYVSDEKKAFYISLVFLLFPFHFHYSMMYTEAVFFTFMIYSFLAIYYRKYWAVTILLIPLVLTRANGIVLLLPLYLFFLEREGILSKKKFDVKLFFSRNAMVKSLVFTTAPLAFLSYCLYQQHMTTHFFAYSIAQRGWGRNLMFPLLAFFRKSSFPCQFNSFYVLFVMTYAVFIWKKNSWNWNILIWVGLLFPLCSGTVDAMPRYMSILFPLFIHFGNWIYSKKINYAFLVLLLATQLAVFYLWVVCHPYSWFLI